VGVAGVGGDPVVGAAVARRGAFGRFIAAVGGDADGALGGDRFAFALGVVVELPADGAAGSFAEQAGDLGGVLEGVPDRARGGLLVGFVVRRCGAHAHVLTFPTRRSSDLVGVAGVGGDPVVGAAVARRGAFGRFIAAVGGDADGALGGDRFAFALGVVVELP